jgi:hypothetical protein
MKPKDFGGDRNMEYLLSKAASRDQSQPRREAKFTATGKGTEVGLPKPSGAQFMFPHVPHVFPGGLWSFFVPLLPHALIPPF